MKQIKLLISSGWFLFFFSFSKSNLWLTLHFSVHCPLQSKDAQRKLRKAQLHANVLWRNVSDNQARANHARLDSRTAHERPDYSTTPHGSQFDCCYSLCMTLGPKPRRSFEVCSRRKQRSTLATGCKCTQICIHVSWKFLNKSFLFVTC